MGKKRKNMGKRGSNESIWPRILKIILIILVIVIFVWALFYTDTGKKLREMLLDYKQPVVNMTAEELRSLGCDKPVAEIRTYSPAGLLGQIPVLNSRLSSEQIYMTGSSESTGLVWDYANGRIYYHDGGLVVNGRDIIVGEIIKGVVNIWPQFLDENSQDYIKFKWDPQSGQGIRADAYQLRMLNGAYKLEGHNYLCKLDNQVNELNKSNNCFVDCFAMNGNCKNSGNIPANKPNYEFSVNDYNALIKPDGTTTDYRYVQMISGPDYILKGSNDAQFINLYGVAKVANDGKVSIIIDKSKWDEITTILSNTYYDRNTQKFMIVGSSSSVAATPCSADESSIGQQGCSANQVCCISKSNVVKRDDTVNGGWKDEMLRDNVEIKISYLTFFSSNYKIYKYISGSGWEITNDNKFDENQGYVEGLKTLIAGLATTDVMIINDDERLTKTRSDSPSDVAEKLFKILAKNGAGPSTAQAAPVINFNDKLIDGNLKIETFSMAMTSNKEIKNLLDVNQVSLDFKKMNWGDNVYFYLLASNNDSFCYALSTDKRVIVKDYITSGSGMKEKIAEFNPSQTDGYIRFIAWKDNQKVIKSLNIAGNEFSTIFSKPISDGENFQNDIMNAPIGSVFIISIQPIWFQTKKDIIQMGNYRITKTSGSSISIEGFYSLDGKDAIKLLNCNEGWSYDLSISRIKSGKNSFRETVEKECKFAKFIRG